ncbi:MAG: hypothetical protein Q4D55_07895 [Eubacteriales bacterium]|nr:hypothetical protein [Eubacteriales bacterium]
MKRKDFRQSDLKPLKWIAILGLLFCLSLPFGYTLCSATPNTYRVSVETGYLALRNAKSYDASNEIGALYTGETVELTDASDPSYWYVYSPKLECCGYVNKDYLVYAASASSTWTVTVSKGYLALRTAKAYDSSNEIGQLYTGDTVDVTDASDDTYWYVYSPKLQSYGYVNRNYLYGGAVSTYTVHVEKGYLALRSAKAFDSSNEIGQLNTGDVVQPIDTSDPAYWYVFSPRLGLYGYVNKDYLIGSRSDHSENMRTVQVSAGYLALILDKVSSLSNEIGRLYADDQVQVIDSSDPDYWYVYSPRYASYGYVDESCLAGTDYETRTVSVAAGYLALRTSMAYDADNEIGQLYTGDMVELVDTGHPEYWYVYAPSLDKYGYVNKNYLR